MRVLIIDNGSLYTHKIAALTDMRHEYDVLPYNPHEDVSDKGYDAIILSGSLKSNVVDTLPDGSAYFARQFDLIRATTKPIMGICLGHQMVNVAFGGTLASLGEEIEFPDMEVSLAKHAQPLFGAPSIRVYEKHTWVVDAIAPGLDVLAESMHGVEILRHTSRPIITTQFHPEYDTSENSLFWDVFALSVQGADTPANTQPVAAIAKYA